jgi:hypothetical protein
MHSYREPRPHWDAAWLRNEYLTKRRSSGDIALEAGVTDAAIIFWLRKHGIPRRSAAEARAAKHWGVSGEANPMHGKCGPLNPRWKGGVSPQWRKAHPEASA